MIATEEQSSSGIKGSAAEWRAHAGGDAEPPCVGAVMPAASVGEGVAGVLQSPGTAAVVGGPSELVGGVLSSGVARAGVGEPPGEGDRVGVGSMAG